MSYTSNISANALQPVSTPSPEALRKKNNAESLKAVVQTSAEQLAKDAKLVKNRNRAVVFQALHTKNNQIQEKGISLSVNLEPFPNASPRGEAKYSSPDRSDQLNALTHLQAGVFTQEDIDTAGCSLGCFVVQDYYHCLCQKLTRELHERKLKPADYESWRAKKMPSITQSDICADSWKTSQHFASFQIFMYVFFGSLSPLLDRGSIWHLPITYKDVNEKNLLDLYEISQEFLNLAKKAPFLGFITEKKLPTAQSFANILAWCEEGLSQNQALMFNPPTHEFDLTHHFRRLNCRRELLVSSLHNLEESLPHLENPYFKEVRHLFCKSQHELSLFATTFGDLSKCTTKKGQKKLLDFLLRSKYNQIGWSDNRHIKTLEATLGAKGGDPDSALLRCLCLYLMELETSLIEEGILTCLTQLLTDETGTQIDGFLKHAISTLEDLHNLPLQPILEKVDALSQNELNESSLQLFTSLKRMAQPTIQMNEYTRAAKELMRFRMDQCQSPSATLMERALAMRDMQIQCGISIKKNFEHFHETILRCGRDSYSEDLHPEVQELFMLIFERLHMGMEAMKGVEAYLNHFLEDIAKNEPAAEKPLKRKKGKAGRKNKAAAKGRKAKPAAVKDNSHVDAPSPSWQQSPIYNAIMAQPLEKKTFANELAAISAHVKELRKQPKPGQLQNFFANNLHNIKHLIRHFQEKESSASFGLDTIFEEMDILRRLMEATLGLGISSSTDINKACTSVDQIKFAAHELHRYLPLIFQDKKIPKNVHTAVQNYSLLVQYFSQANACINYLGSAKGQTDLPASTKQLLDYFAAVKAEAQNPIPQEDLRHALWQMHQKHAELILSFVGELMHSLADPRFMPQARDLQLPSIDKERPAAPDAGQQLEDCEESHSHAAADAAPPSTFKHHIHSRRQAVQAVDSALLWLKILELHPVEGDIERGMRAAKRNSALENVETSLLWLQEKLRAEDYSTCYTSVLGAMELVRRAHQELSKGLLYHSGKLVQDEHIVKALHLAHSSNPVYLNQLVLQNSPHAEFLPNLLEKKYMWMSDARQALSYPRPPLPRKENIWTNQVRKLSETTKKYYRLLKKTADGSSIVEGNKTFNTERVQEKIEAFAHKEEAEKVFTALEALLQILEYGISGNATLEKIQ